MRELRLFCSGIEAVGRLISDVRIAEHNIAMLAYVTERNGEDVFLVKENEKARRWLGRFYFLSGLASGKHTAKLLIEDIEAQARDQVTSRPR